MSAQPITRDDIERSLRSIQAGVTDKVRSKKQTIVQGATIAGALLVVLVFLLGRKSGRKRNTIVEIRARVRAMSEKKGYGLYSPRAAFNRKIFREVRGGSQAWLVLGASLWVLGRIRRAVSRGEEFASLDRLRPGQGLVITTIARPSRRQRRKAERAAGLNGH